MEPEEVEAQIEELESRLERLRSLYEQYFLGIEKIEPAVARKDVDRRIWQLRREQIRNTARRFRLQVIIQRYNTFQQYWQRICREIENGTYKRHLLRAERSRGGGGEMLTIKAKRRAGMYARDASEPAQESDAEPSAPAPPPAAPAQGVPEKSPAAIRPVAAAPERRDDFERLDLDLDFAGGRSRGAPAAAPERSRPAGRAVARRLPDAPSSGAVPPPRPAPARSTRADPGLSDQRVRELHARLVDAKRQVNDTRSISVDGLKQRLAAAETKLRQQHGNRRIDFDVVIRDGKAVVKPILR